MEIEHGGCAAHDGTRDVARRSLEDERAGAGVADRGGSVSISLLPNRQQSVRAGPAEDHGAACVDANQRSDALLHRPSDQAAIAGEFLPVLSTSSGTEN